MPARRSPEVLRALANDPIAGWVQTPLVNKSAHVEALSAPYLASFLKHHDLPASYAVMEALNGARLWDVTKLVLEAGAYERGRRFTRRELKHWRKPSIMASRLPSTPRYENLNTFFPKYM